MRSDLPFQLTQVVFARRPTGEPTLDCFRVEQAPIPPLTQGQVLVRNDFLSVDPYIRMRMEAKDSYAKVMSLGDVMVGRTAGEVIASECPEYQVGDWVVGRLGWQSYSVSSPQELQRIDVSLAPASAYLGALGSTGVTAWIGLHLFGQPQVGETVLVSAASGAVGSVVGQLAKLAGCRAIGLAGGAEKCRIVKDIYGFDDCLDYHSKTLPEDLKHAAPQGFDIYFDNVGGEIFDAVLPLMNNFGRIPLCGLVSQYNRLDPYRVKNLREVFNKRLTMRGFVISDHKDLWPQATEVIVSAYKAGKLHYRETIANGLECAPRAFLDVLAGKKIGKQIVRISSPS
jgi:NADPH-dependent curcumin reductase CurA